MAPRAKASEHETHPGTRLGIPLVQPGVQDHSFHTQAVFEIHLEIGKLEVGQSGVDARLKSVESKLDVISGQITVFCTTIETLRPVFIWAIRGIWGIFGAAVVFLLGVFSMWLKHKMGW